MRKYIGLNQFIAGYPRFAIEALGITIFALIAFVNISLGKITIEYLLELH